jgi:hypothetical protein
VYHEDIRLLRPVSELPPGPELFYAAPNAEGDVGPYVLYRYAEGITFQELKAQRSRPQEILQELKGGRLGRYFSPGCGEQAMPLYPSSHAIATMATEPRRYRLTVRTEPSQGLNQGSIPVSATNPFRIICLQNGRARSAAAALGHRYGQGAIPD